MTTVSLRHGLSGLYFAIVNAIDEGAKATTDEAQAAMENENLMELLDRFYEIDISLYGEEKRAAINQLFEAHVPDRSNRLGFRNNGLGYVAGVLVNIMLRSDWRDAETGEMVDFDNLEIEV